MLAGRNCAVHHPCEDDDAFINVVKRIEDLLDVARITQKDLTIHRLPVDLHRVIADTLDGWTTVLSQRRITLDVQLQAGAC